MMSLSAIAARLRAAAPIHIKPRLYFANGLLLATVLALAIGAVVYARYTARVVTGIAMSAVATAKTANDAALLLERHWRVVQTSPLQTSKWRMHHQQKAARSLIAQMRAAFDVGDQFKSTPIVGYLERLSERGSDVMRLAAAGDAAGASAATPAYDEIARELQKLIVSIRDANIARSRNYVEGLVSKGTTLANWAFVLLLITILLSGPLSLAIVRDVTRRIEAITIAMRGLAINDMTVRVPFVDDPDEIGDMARALGVFKRNALVFVERSRDVERLNAGFDIALNNMARGLSMFDGNGRLVVCNRAYRELYGLTDEVARPGVPLDGLIDQYLDNVNTDEASRLLTREGWTRWMLSVVADGEPFTNEHTTADGRKVVVHVQPLPGGGWVDLHEDVTEKLRVEARITHLASTDALTGLANRYHFFECLANALRSADGRRSFAILWIDLDHFKEVNDTFGHPAGDQLLKAVAARLVAGLRSNDVTARLGGDEFAVLVRGPGIAADEATRLADRVIARISEPYEIGGQKFTIGASIGIAIAPEHGGAPDELMKNADIALYRAKTKGRGACVLYQPNFEQEMKSRRQSEIELRQAVANGELALYYQPIIDLDHGRVTSCEALMRWRHPERGLVSPAEFIPLAEEIGLIGAMGSWAVAQACRDASTWPDHVKVAVNLSADQFDGSDFVATVVSALAAAHFPPSRLELEVTETLLLKNNARTLAALELLRKIGVGIALDDFGTGYSSLSYLRSFPFTKIKIDQSFVRDLPRREDCTTIVRAVAGLARALDMKTVAEGVETPEHLSLVAAARCNEAQGYYFSRPVPAEEAAAAIEHCSRLASASATAA